MHLGIDIGTHTARAAYLDEAGQPQLVTLPDGTDVFPAFARQTMHGLIVGGEAAHGVVGNAETTVGGCTRLMGRASSLPPALLARLPYPVRDAGGEAVCNLLYAEVRATEVYGRIARALVDAAQQSLGQEVECVALSLPASAEDRFRIQARAAVEAQGIRVRRLINQPAAALLALTHNSRNVARQPARSLPHAARTVAIVSAGGGTTEASIAEHSERGWRVVATSGDPLLGGEDFTWTLAEALNDRFRVAAGLDVFAVGDSRVAALGLRAATEDALLRLHNARETLLTLDHGGGFGRDLATPVRRDDVDAWLAPDMGRIFDLCRRAVANVRKQPDAVVVIGEWAALPQLRQTVQRAFGRAPLELDPLAASQLAVLGAALAVGDTTASVWDVTPYPLGINCYYGERELLSPIIRANTPIPTPAVDQPGAHTESYQTRFPNQSSVTIDVLQYRGVRDASPFGAGRVPPAECELLGSWSFNGLRPKRGTCAAFTVTFAVDEDGILHLVARETATGHTLAAQVERGIG